MDKQSQLEQVIEQLVGAMKASVQHGSTDHLDCHQDGGEFWHNAIELAEAVLGYRIPASTDRV